MIRAASGSPRSPTANDAIGGWKPKGFVNLALLKGYKFSFQSSSDHTSTHISYALVYADGNSREAVLAGRVLLWKGHCSVHQMFQPQHILRFRNQYPDGLVISHPECSFEVCKNSDYVGSTDYIINTIRAAKEGTRWLVGTELNLVNRIAEEFKPQGIGELNEGGLKLASALADEVLPTIDRLSAESKGDQDA